MSADEELPNRKVKSRSNVLPLFVCLLLAAAIAWLAWTLEQQEQHIAALGSGQRGQQSALDERLRTQQAQFEAQLSTQQAQLDGRIDQRLGVQVDGRLDEALGGLLDERISEQLSEQTVAQIGEQIADQIAARQTQWDEQRDRLEELVSNLQALLSATRSELENQSAGMAELREQISTVGSGLENLANASRDEQAWLLAEVESLLRQAQQRLLVAHDAQTAIALMQAGDDMLRDIDDSRLLPVREALANDMAALRRVPARDVEGGYVRLNAVMGRIDNLQLRDITQEQLAAAETVEVGGGTLDRWLQQFTELVSVRRLDEPLQGMISTEQGYFVRQNIRLLLEQAQLALWRGEDGIYRGNIDQVMDHMRNYFLADDAEFRAALETLQQLREWPVAIEIPPASSGLRALQRVMASYQRSQGSPATENNNGQ